MCGQNVWKLTNKETKQLTKQEANNYKSIARLEGITAALLTIPVL